MLQALASRLTRTKNVNRSAVVWNAVSACLTSFQTMLLLLLLTHFGPEEHGGYFVMAYTVANLMMHIGKFGMRQYQVTDAGETWSFREYAASRVFSVGLMGLALAVYLLWGVLSNGYTAEKAAVVALITFFRAIEAAEDVFHGRLQQRGRLDVASKILALRNGIFMLGFALCYLLTKNLILTCALNAAFSLALCLLLNGAVMKESEGGASPGQPQPAAAASDSQRSGVKKSGIPWRLIRECLPLCLTMVTYMYLGNAPKYIVDGLVSEAVQTRFNIVMMPTFVVSLLCTFIFNPVLRRIGALWQAGDTAALKKLALRLAAAPIAIDGAVLVGGWFLGLPLLSRVYGVDLAGYRETLMALLLSGGAIALLNLFVALLTAMRRQRFLLLGYALVSAFLLAVGRPLYAARGLNAVCWCYLFALLALAAGCAIAFALALRKAASDR